MFRLSKSISGNGGVEETPMDEGKLGMCKAIGSRGLVEFGLDGHGK